MSDLIDRQEVLDIISQYDSAHIKLFGEPIRGLAAILADIEDLPSEPEYDIGGYSSRLWKAAYERGKQDAEPERARGRWTVTSLYIKCSKCGEAFPIMPQKFCPNCGAEMEATE